MISNKPAAAVLGVVISLASTAFARQDQSGAPPESGQGIREALGNRDAVLARLRGQDAPRHDSTTAKNPEATPPGAPSASPAPVPIDPSLTKDQLVVKFRELIQGERDTAKAIAHDRAVIDIASALTKDPAAPLPGRVAAAKVSLQKQAQSNVGLEREVTQLERGFREPRELLEIVRAAEGFEKRLEGFKTQMERDLERLNPKGIIQEGLLESTNAREKRCLETVKKATEGKFDPRTHPDFQSALARPDLAIETSLAGMGREELRSAVSAKAGVCQTLLDQAKATSAARTQAEQQIAQSGAPVADEFAKLVRIASAQVDRSFDLQARQARGGDGAAEAELWRTQVIAVHRDALDLVKSGDVALKEAKAAWSEYMKVQREQANGKISIGDIFGIDPGPPKKK